MDWREASQVRNQLKFSDIRIAVIGLGYVGLPLAAEFAKKYFTVGYDINGERIKEIEKGFDKTSEIESVDLEKVLVKSISEKGLFVTDNIKELQKSNYYIVTKVIQIICDFFYKFICKLYKILITIFRVV